MATVPSQAASCLAFLNALRIPNGGSQRARRQRTNAGDLLQLPGPVVRPTTGFHAHQACWQVREALCYLVAPELLPYHRLVLFINPMHLDNVLCQIQPDCRNLHYSRLSWLVVHRNAHFGT